MEEQSPTYEFGPKEQRREIFGRLLYLSLGRFAKRVVNLLPSLIRPLKQFIKDALWMLSGRRW